MCLLFRPSFAVAEQIWFGIYVRQQGKFFKRIFNRAGQKVFETTNPAEGWDGTVNGIPQPLDTYVWMVEAVSKYGAPIRENGLVTLLR